MAYVKDVKYLKNYRHHVRDECTLTSLVPEIELFRNMRHFTIKQWDAYNISTGGIKERELYPTFASSKRAELEESMMDTKAKLMKSNIDIQETECIEKQLALLEKYKGSAFDNEEEEYDSAVKDLINELPLMKKRKGM